MLRYHLAIVSRDNRLKREIKRVTAATGSTADFIGDASGLDPNRPANLAIYDARSGEPDKQFLSKLPRHTPIAYVLQSERLIDRLALFRDERVTSLLCHDADFDDDEFIASTTKALRGEIFGLQKYFPWGVTTYSMVVKSYEEKSKAIDILLHYAKLAGVRGPVRDRIQLVSDELMMNALYHAPVDEQGKERFRERTLKELSQLPEVPPIEVQYGCSGRYFGISVRDGGGSLTRPRALDYLLRAKSGTHIENKATGAGLGLISVLRSVSKLIFNLEPGHSTEVIALFDLELFAKGQVGARSLHMFLQAPAATDEDDDDDDEQPDAEPHVIAPSRSGRWLLAALLLSVVTAMATALVMKQSAPASAAQSVEPTVTVLADPPDAEITFDGRQIANEAAVPLEAGVAHTVLVRRDGFEPYRTQLAPDANNDIRLVVSLRPTR